MKFKLGLAVLFLLLLSASGSAQETASAAESVEKLKAQLVDVQAREEALRVRLQQLDESTKPENIERSLAGIGSTRCTPDSSDVSFFRPTLSVVNDW